MATKTESEKYRRDRSKLTPKNEGLTMGALYWQLNDVWQAPTWSSIEFGGRWKMLHFYAKKFFAPVLVSPEYTDDGFVNVYIISDLLKEISEVRLNTSVYSWDDFTPKAVLTSTVTLDAASSKIFSTYKMTDILQDLDCIPSTCFLHFTVQGSDFFSDNFLYPVPFGLVSNLESAGITAVVQEVPDSNEVIIFLLTDKIAPFVWLETDAAGEFTDNGFTMVSSTSHVGFSRRNNEAVDVDHLRDTLTVRSLIK